MLALSHNPFLFMFPVLISTLNKEANNNQINGEVVLTCMKHLNYTVEHFDSSLVS